MVGPPLGVELTSLDEIRQTCCRIIFILEWGRQMTLRNTFASLAATAALAFSATTVSANSHNDYEPVEDCAWWNVGCDITQHANRYNTQYPIVLVHGVSGFDKILFIEYWHGIPSELRGGDANVWTPNLTAWGGSEQRGEQLIDYINNVVLPATGASKVNLIGHSQGSPTSRYVASTAPDIVASVTSVHGANGGSPFNDMMLNSIVPPDHPMYDAYVAFNETLLNALGDVVDFLASGESFDQQSFDAVYQLSTAGQIEYNANYPEGKPTTECGSGAEEVNGISYYSWGGFAGVTNVLDPLDYAMTIVGALSAPGTETDGLVPRCAQHWGKVLRDDYQHNHTDGSNMLLGMSGWTDPKDIFESHASRLRQKGL